MLVVIDGVLAGLFLQMDLSFREDLINKERLWFGVGKGEVHRLPASPLPARPSPTPLRICGFLLSLTCLT